MEQKLPDSKNLGVKSVFRTESGQRLIYSINLDNEGLDDKVNVSFYDVSTSAKHNFRLDKCTPGLSEILHSYSSSTPIHGNDVSRLFEYLEPKICRQGICTDGTRLNHDKILDANTSVHDVEALIRNARDCIESTREELRSLSKNSPKALEYQEIIGNSYKLMGNMFLKLKKNNKAIVCYTLALKANPELTSVRESLRELFSKINPEQDDDAFGIQDVEDIEDLLKKKTILADAGHQMKFSCTRCGECCRTRDNIYLSPLDIYNISRGASMGSHQLMPTMRIYKHPIFSQALVFGRDSDGYPTCHLRPKKSSLGRCHFSYPLFASDAGESDHRAEDQKSKILSWEDTEQYLTSCEEKNRLASEYIEDGGLNAQSVWQICEDEFDEKYSNVHPMMNASGQQALGCMLGKSDMPTLCASFPLVPESDMTGSVKDDFNLPSISLVLGDGVSAGASKRLQFAAPLKIRTEESFVMVEAYGCEGFAVRTERQVDTAPSGFESFDNNEFDNRRHCEEELYKVNDYLQDWHLREKWPEMRWFNNLRQRLAQYLPCNVDSMKHERIVSHYSTHMKKIWYDFDRLARPGRPIRTYTRLRDEIESASWSLARATKVFLQNIVLVDENASTSCDAEDKYVVLLERLDLLHSFNYT